MLIATLVGIGERPTLAQDLEPRAYASSPVGMTFVLVGLGRSSGNVLIDPSLPFDDVNARLLVATAGVGHTFDLFGRSALVVAVAPYARAHVSGQLQEATREATRVGWADARVRFSINLLGGRARRRREFAAAPRSTIVGLSVTTVAPTGQYAANRLVNLGSHRWSWKPEMGVSVPVGRWHIDGYVGAWLFGANDAFYPGTVRRRQDPVLATQGHVSYTFRPRLWAAADVTWYAGGTTSTNGIKNADRQRNSRVGVTASLPLGAGQSIKVAYSTGTTTRVGGDFETVGVAWQMAWTR